MKKLSAILMAAGVAGSVSYGQAVPAGVSDVSNNWTPTLPSFAGTMHYSLTASELVQLGYYGSGNLTASTAFSGNAGYSTTSERVPFSILASGGFFFPDSGIQGQGVSEYATVAVSQTVIEGRWIFNISDSVSYLPESPTTGLSGIAGIGDIGYNPVSGPSEGPAGGIISISGSRVSNTISGSAERRLTGATSLSANGNWSKLYFLDQNAGINTSLVSGGVGINHRLDGRDSVSVDGNYSSYSFNSGGSEFHTEGVSVAFQRSLTKTLSMSVSAGPEWISGVESNTSLIASVTAGLTYMRKNGNFAVNYIHGVNGGSGVLPGAVSNSIFFSGSRSLTRDWLATSSGGYTRSSGLALPGSGFSGTETSSTFFGGVQVSRAFSRRFSGYASYNAQEQSLSQSFAGENAFNGLAHTFGIGISYTPQSTRLGQF